MAGLTVFSPSLFLSAILLLAGSACQDSPSYYDRDPTTDYIKAQVGNKEACAAAPWPTFQQQYRQWEAAYDTHQDNPIHPQAYWEQAAKQSTGQQQQINQAAALLCPYLADIHQQFQAYQLPPLLTTEVLYPLQHIYHATHQQWIEYQLELTRDNQPELEEAWRQNKYRRCFSQALHQATHIWGIPMQDIAYHLEQHILLAIETSVGDTKFTKQQLLAGLYACSHAPFVHMSEQCTLMYHFLSGRLLVN